MKATTQYRIGDTVYAFVDGILNKLTVTEIRDVSNYEYPIKCVGPHDEVQTFTYEGQYNLGGNPVLSFTPYNLVTGGATFIRPRDYKDYIGKAGFFWDSYMEVHSDEVRVGVLVSVSDDGKDLELSNGTKWNNFLPFEDLDTPEGQEFKRIFNLP